MENYVGLKLIKAEPMNLGDYNKFKGWDIPKDEDPLKEGYKVQYSDSYISWSPKEVFEEAYKKSGELSFEQALYLLKQGFNIARKGWNGKDQFVYLLSSSKLAVGLKYGFGEYEGEPRFIDTFVLKTTQNNLVVGWVPSIGDLLANDWKIVE